MKFKHGDRVKCTIKGIEIEDAMISINEDRTPFICQNYEKGFNADDKLGYKFSWELLRDFTGTEVSDLRLAVKDLDHLEEGDTLVDVDGKEMMVLGVHKYLVHLSCDDDFDEYSANYTIKELEENDFKLKDQPDETLEVTLDEIADKFNVDVKNLKVKKDNKRKKC